MVHNSGFEENRTKFPNKGRLLHEQFEKILQRTPVQMVHRERELVHSGLAPLHLQVGVDEICQGKTSDGIGELQGIA